MGALAGHVYPELRRSILENVLKPGQRVSENELAAKLGVSRTPIREALIRLMEEGLVEVQPRRGTFVTPISVQRVFEAHALREVLEDLVVRHAAQRATASDKHRLQVMLDTQRDAVSSGDYVRFRMIDDSFHLVLSQIAGLPRAWELVNSLKTDLDRARSLVQRDPGRAETAALEHEHLIEAISNNDADAAAGAMKRHLSQTFAAIQAVIRHHGDLFVG